MEFRRTWMTAAIIFGGIAIGSATAQKRYAPGVSDYEIKIGQTMPYSGPVSAWGTIGRAELAYVKMINDQGGVNGRKINLISLDDAYSPPKTVEQTRRLVEQDGVAVIFGGLGTAANLAVRKYLNDRQVPQLFLLSGSEQFNDPEHFPWSIGIIPTYLLDGQTHARYILAHSPNAKIAILYQSDDYGKAHVKGLKDGLGERAKHLIVSELSYEVGAPTIESQMVTLKASGANTLYIAAGPKFAAQAIRKANELAWRPLQFLTYTSQSISGVLEPAGLENAIGILSASFAKDPTDPRWKDDPDMKEYFEWVQKYNPNTDGKDTFVAAGYQYAAALVLLLRQCGDDLSRENIMRRATSLHDFTIPLLLPGITLNTSPGDYQPIKQLRESRFNGKFWESVDEDKH
ncbi:ABC transporter substrate-binding protein [Bradyrhizobium sp. JYMT SZCCT0180]|uniref:ABC transporter substrate-binding protein n=1 Tax=Bradyrhizobium sp. JYMT SZCCT0180 TaxID=2807666 RepID=UPI001BA66003|nr:ABC transporter substrate-binding protein [Bradyrhizobium sp. JYMT SZCCT0180]MBR1211991.1 ABC transporter substrate-binding protein [Bradyrhizobium sp. JYMT SZCCT0180]